MWRQRGWAVTPTCAAMAGWSLCAESTLAAHSQYSYQAVINSSQCLVMIGSWQDRILILWPLWQPIIRQSFRLKINIMCYTRILSGGFIILQHSPENTTDTAQWYQLVCLSPSFPLLLYKLLFPNQLRNCYGLDGESVNKSEGIGSLFLPLSFHLSPSVFFLLISIFPTPSLFIPLIL